MAIYNKSGSDIYAAYGISGTEVSFAYDLSGNEVYAESPDIPVTPLSWDMTEAYQNQVLDALRYIRRYQQSNAGAYSICQFNDVHEVFSGNEPNFIDYNKGYKTISRMIFNGDFANTTTPTTSQNAITFIEGAQATPRIIVTGNHEYFKSGITNPETVYKPSVSVSATYMETENNALIYYSDDSAHNVRYIVLDYFYVTKAGGDSDHILDDAQLDWCASAMASAGSKDIIIAGHTCLRPFTFVVTGAETTDTINLTNQQNLINLIAAYKARTTYRGYSFSNCSGKFIMYTSGHYHAIGYADMGFAFFTCTSLLNSLGGSSPIGFTFYIIDKANNKIKMLVCGKSLGTYSVYDFPIETQ